MNFRNYIYGILPPWLKKEGGWSARLPYAFGIALDAVADASTQAVKARFPGVGTRTALPLIGKDRGITRGFSESNFAYAGRLRDWLKSWKIAGSPFAIMESIRGYVAPWPVRIRVVDNSGNWYTLAEDGTKSFYRNDNWHWDSDYPTKWHRYWVIIYPLGLWQPSPKWGDPDLWGGAWGNPGYVWGSSGITSEQIETLKNLVLQWGPAGPYCSHIIIAFDEFSFEPNGSSDAYYPNGDWDDPDMRLHSATYIPVKGA